MHVLGEAFKKDAKVDITHIPFKGAAPLKQEMLAGRLQVGGDQLSSSLAEIKAGTLKALATTASKRIPGLPDVPTVKELGFPNLELEGWNGVFAPAKTSDAIVNRLNQAIRDVSQDADMQELFAKEGAEPMPYSPAQTAAYVKAEVEKWRKVARDANIQANN
jgi:tripartite-type tricarboxylate transporter receptor subunit TctC